MSGKPKIALCWCSSCGGCEESVVDLAEDLLAVAEQVDIVFWPVALDAKHADVEALADRELAASFINGAVRMDGQEAVARLLRAKSRLVFAHGSCAHLGGVVGLGNFFSLDEILHRSYQEVPSVRNPEGILPGSEESDLSRCHPTVKALDQVIDVDYYIPGCPPTPFLLKKAFTMLLEGALPAKGTVLAEKKALCDTCPRQASLPDRAKVDRLKRLYETEWDPDRCFLDQGIICLGPATRGGCGARCIAGNMPCRGCFGPTDNVRDQGAKALSLVASFITGPDEAAWRAAVETIPDPGGLFYRYSLASSLLKRGKQVR